MTELSLVSLLVRDYDEAIDFYVDRLGFELVEDSDLGDGKRWVVVRSVGGKAALLLARANNAEQRACVGKQAGGRVFLFLTTDDWDREYARLVEQGVEFTEEPRDEEYGRVAVFLDLYGNRCDLIEPRTSRQGLPANPA